MNVKSLLLGSAAAVAAASGAYAADPVVVVEPVATNYVEVCDAFGKGYFYIPGTETCLDIGGYVRFQVDFVTSPSDQATWDVFTKAHLAVSSKTDTELGVLTGDIELNAYAYGDGTSSKVELDQTYLGLGGFQAGYFTSYWDEGLIGEIDHLSGNTKFNSMRYVFLGDGYVAGISLDALTPDMVNYTGSNDMAKLGVSGRVGFKAGGVGMKLDGGYDTYNEEGSLRFMSSFALGPGSLNLGAQYSSGFNAYANSFSWFSGTGYTKPTNLYSEWAVAAGYALKATDKFTITPAVQWTTAKADNMSDKNYWEAGALFDYTIVDGFHAKLNLRYADLPDPISDAFGGWFRLQRDF
ncbi:porin [Martelella sp. HB161492]|uniref:porin n=1 Tax=Martelella sp. HB161492 TaxID=2720726 RepID=UPI00159054A0|nr:porin [Martelella sp. HB161492]